MICRNSVVSGQQLAVSGQPSAVSLFYSKAERARVRVALKLIAYDNKLTGFDIICDLLFVLRATVN